MTISNIMIFSGNANPNLALKTVEFLNMPLGKITAGKFSDGEVMVEVNENVRGRDIYIMQPICAPANDNLMELLVIADALRRASAARITAVIPYLGYARQDRRSRSSRVPITAKMVANMIASAGIDRVLTVDLHADQIQGFFDIPLDNVYGSPVLLGDIWKHKYPDLIVISPDVGGVVRARALAKRLDDTDLAIIDKRRPNPNESEIMNIIGDVKKRSCFIVDDIVDSAGTLCNAAQALMDSGAVEVYAYVTHGVLSGEAIERVNDSSLKKLIITDTIEESEEVKNSEKIETVSVVPLLGEAIKRISEERSVSSLFD